MGLLIRMILIGLDFSSNFGKSAQIQALLAVGSPHTESPSDRQSQCKQVTTLENNDDISPHI